MANGYAENLTIDRENNDGGYQPDNCRWVTYTRQARNTRRSRLLTAFGETKTAVEWSEDPRCLVSQGNLMQRLHGGWSDYDAITLPSRCRGQACRP